jgi:hypothetical protein
MAAFPTSTQLTNHGDDGPWSASTKAGRLSNVGYAEATFAVESLGKVGWKPPMVWIDVEPRPAQPWPSSTYAQRFENRFLIEGLMRGLRDKGFSYGLYSFTSGWAEITGSWRLPGVPVWATAGRLDHPTEALDRCTQPSFSGGRVYLSQWYDDTRDYDRTCEPYAFTNLPIPRATLSNSTAEFNGSWQNDLLARRSSTGAVTLFRGTGSGGLLAGVSITSDWSKYDVLETVGDLSGDGLADVVARERATGYLWLYKGNGRGGWLLPRVVIGSGWQVMDRIVGAGDLNGDERVDLVARRATTGELFLYPGTGSGGLKPRVLIGTNWAGYSLIVAPGDFSGNGRSDLLARERSTGYLWLFPGNGTGRLGSRVRVGTGWNSMTVIMSPGDFNGDRTADLLARDSSGSLWLYGRTATGTWKPRVLVSTGWNGFNRLF